MIDPPYTLISLRVTKLFICRNPEHTCPFGTCPVHAAAAAALISLRCAVCIALSEAVLIKYGQLNVQGLIRLEGGVAGNCGWLPV